MLTGSRNSIVIFILKTLWQQLRLWRGFNRAGNGSEGGRRVGLGSKNSGKQRRQTTGRAGIFTGQVQGDDSRAGDDGDPERADGDPKPAMEEDTMWACGDDNGLDKISA
ncbi:hypothetical protein Dimus_033912 [Dionaea muscipula]